MSSYSSDEESPSECPSLSCPQCDEYKEKIEYLENKNEFLQKAITKRKRQNQLLKTQYQQLDDDNQELEEEMRSLQTKYKDLNIEKIELQDETQSLQIVSKKLHKKNQALQARNKDLLSKLEELKRKCQDLGAQREGSESESQSVRVQNEKLEQDNEELEQDNTSLREKIKALEEDIKQRDRYYSRGRELMKSVRDCMKNLDDFMENAISTYPCRERRCKTCDYIMETNQFTSHSTKEVFKVEHPISCQTKHLVYLIQCKRCGQQYVGETGNTLNTRMIRHRYDIRHMETSCGVAEHFCKKDHSVDDLQVMGIEAGLEDAQRRKQREKHWKDTLDTLKNGMNKK